MNHVMELTMFQLNDGTKQEEFLEASKKFADFLGKQEGLVSRKLTCFNENEWADIAEWENMDTAMAIEKEMAKSADAGLYMSHINPSTVKMMHMEIVQ